MRRLVENRRSMEILLGEATSCEAGMDPSDLAGPPQRVALPDGGAATLWEVVDTSYAPRLLAFVDGERLARLVSDVDELARAIDDTRKSLEECRRAEQRHAERVCAGLVVPDMEDD